MRPFCTGSIVLAIIFRAGIRAGLDEFDFPCAGSRAAAGRPDPWRSAPRDHVRPAERGTPERRAW
jgi:hypothetical protein